MTAYLLRRLLLLIPTFVGILLINFAVLRLQSNSLSDSLTGELAGERRAAAAAPRIETLLDRFRRTGNDLPVLLNWRGFTTKDDLVATLRRAAPDSGRPDSERNRIEQELWLGGPLLVEPLAAILADDGLVDLHGPASQALTLCAYVTITPRDLECMPAARLRHIEERNRALRDLAIACQRLPGRPFHSDDPLAASKRAALLAIVHDPANQADFSREGRWSAVLLATGWSDFLRRLATGDLWSESRHESAFSVIGRAWSTTAWLNLLAIAIAWAVAVPLGIRSARRVGTTEDRTTTNALFMLWSLQSFFIGTLLLHYLCTDSSTSRALFPNHGLSSADSLWMSTPRYLLDLLWHGTLPLFTLSYASFVSLSRYLRANLLEQLSSDYIRTARAKGVSEDDLVYRHALRNSSVTLITLGAGLLAELFGGVLIVEKIFSIPGLGMLLVDAAQQQDAPLMMAATIIQVGLLQIGILLADIGYAVVDPRIRSRYA